ncbi:MAG: hypothetical protein AVDCRST_MAG68-529, partial [uncultured Gemmatimonadetes bacterium]
VERMAVRTYDRDVLRCGGLAFVRGSAQCTIANDAAPVWRARGTGHVSPRTAV